MHFFEPLYAKEPSGVVVSDRVDAKINLKVVYDRRMENALYKSLYVCYVCLADVSHVVLLELRLDSEILPERNDGRVRKY